MKRCLAALVAAMIVSGPATVRAAPPDGPFEVVPLPAPNSRPHLAAYACLASGAVLVAASFGIAHRADQAYDRYLVESDPLQIDRRFDEATRYDRWSSGTLLTGEAVLATGLYLRFLRRPGLPVAVALGPGRCAVWYRF